MMEVDKEEVLFNGWDLAAMLAISVASLVANARTANRIRVINVIESAQFYNYAIRVPLLSSGHLLLVTRRLPPAVL